MFGTSWRVGRIAGIEVRVDSSWAVIALLITYSMYLRASILYPELSGRGAVALGILATVLFFGSVLVHELLTQHLAWLQEPERLEVWLLRTATREAYRMRRLRGCGAPIADSTIWSNTSTQASATQAG